MCFFDNPLGQSAVDNSMCRAVSVDDDARLAEPVIEYLSRL
jgi:hypothetical protein